MRSTLEFLFAWVFVTGLLGVVFILLALLDAWLHFRATEARRGVCLASIAVRLAFLAGCLWSIADQVLIMMPHQITAQQRGEWSNLGYWMGMLGPADRTLHIWVDFVLATFCMWLFVTALMYASRILLSWRESRLMPERTRPLSITDVSNLVSALMLSGVLCGMRVALRLLCTE